LEKKKINARSLEIQQNDLQNQGFSFKIFFHKIKIALFFYYFKATKPRVSGEKTLQKINAKKT